MKKAFDLKAIFHPVQLTLGSCWKTILLFSLPIIVSYLLQQVYSISDAAIVGQTLTADEVAGVTDTTPLVFVFLQFAFGSSAGFCAVTSCRVGTHDDQGVRRSLATQFVLSTVLTVVLTALALALLNPMLAWINVTPDSPAVYNAAHTYCMIIFSGIGAQLFYNFICSFLRSMGDSATPLLFLLFSTVLNVGLDLLFILAFHWGVAGAAIATVAAQLISTFACFFYAFSKYPQLRLVAEAANPQGDVLWGGGADTLAAYNDYFEPYVCANDEFIGAAYKDPNGYWIGESPLPMVFIYNKTMLSEDEVPTTWEGLCDENLKGKIAYCSPSKSGSAYTQLCTMLFSQPTIDEGWALVEKFIANLDGKLQDSSGNCHKLVASGEYALGVTIEKSAVLYNDNPDIGYVYPEKNSAVPDGVALIKGCPNEENAKLFIDFVTSAECQTAQNADWARRPVRSDVAPQGLCSLDDCNVGNYDFDYAAANRDSIKEKFNDLIAG